MSISTPTLATIGEIAHRLREPVHRVEYVIRVRRISPCGWAGNARVFPEKAVDAIAFELQRIDAGRAAIKTTNRFNCRGPRRRAKGGFLSTHAGFDSSAVQ